MPYDKSQEKILHTKEIPDYDDASCKAGTILQAVQYLDWQPNVVLLRYRIDKTTGEKKVVPFISIPPGSIARVVADMTSLASYIETKYPRQQKAAG